MNAEKRLSYTDSRAVTEPDESPAGRLLADAMRAARHTSTDAMRDLERGLSLTAEESK